MINQSKARRRPRRSFQSRYLPNPKMTPLMKIFSVFVSASIMIMPVYATGELPTGASVTHGNVNIGVDGAAMQIDQLSNQAIVNWQSFGIGAGNSVLVNQPSATSAMLSRVVGADPSNILGSLQANGIFYLVNPNGVYFGQGAQVDVGSLIVSTLDINDEDFLSGNAEFSGDSDAVITNDGAITAIEAAILVAKNVENRGLIAAPQAALVANDKLLVDTVAGGRIMLRLKGNGGDAINSGTMNANGSDGGSITIAGDRVAQLGTVSADALEGDGGSISLSADSVVAIGPNSLTTANASSNGNGGEVIAFSPDTALFRSGAVIEATGGSESGDGGFVEVSGIEHVEIAGWVDASATNGIAGTFLIDPTDITITDVTDDITVDGGAPNPQTFTPTGNANSISDDTIEGFLNAGTSVTLDTAVGGFGGAGNITQNADAAIDFTGAGGAATLRLDADNNIVLNGGINAAGAALNVDLNATGDVQVNAGITTNGGTFNSDGVLFDNNVTNAGPINTGAGAIAINHTGTVGIDEALTTTSTVDINGVNVNINTGINSNGLTITNTGTATIAAPITAGGTILFDGTGGVTLGTNIQTTADDAEINVNTSTVTLTGDVTLETNNGAINLDEVITNTADDHVLSLIAGTDDITVNDNIGVDGMELTGLTITSANNVNFTGANATVDTNNLTVTNAAGEVRFDAAVNIDGNVDVNTATLDLNAALNTSNAGTVTVTNTGVADLGNQITSAGTMSFDGTGGITLGANIQTTDDDAEINVASSTITINNDRMLQTNNGAISIDEVQATSQEDFTLTLAAGTDDITINDNVGVAGTELAGLTINSANNVHFSGADATINSAALDIDNVTGETRFDGVVTIGGNIDINTAALDLNATMNATDNGTVTITNTGAADIGAQITSEGTVDFDGNGGITLGANIQTTDDDSEITIPTSVLTLSGDRTLQTNNGAINIDEVLTDTADDHVLTLIAGTDNITINDNVGVDGAELAGLTVTSANDVHFSSGAATIDSNNLTITSATGNTRFDGTVSVDGNVDINTAMLDLNQPLNTTEDGTVTITNTGTADIGGQITSEGTVSFDGNGLVALAANIQTTDDDAEITASDSIIQLTGDHSLQTNNGAIGIDQVITDTADDHVLTLIAGTDDVTVDDSIGMEGTELAGLTVTSAGNVNFSGAGATIDSNNVDITATNNVTFDGVTMIDGGIAVAAGDDILVNANMTETVGNINLNAGNDADDIMAAAAGATIDAQNGTVTVDGEAVSLLQVDAGGDAGAGTNGITVTADVNVNVLGAWTTDDGNDQGSISITAGQDVTIAAVGSLNSDDDIDINAGRSVGMDMAALVGLVADDDVTVDGGAGGTLDLDAITAGGDIQVGATTNTAAVNALDAWNAGGFVSVDGTSATLLAVTAGGNNGGTGIAVNATTTDVNVNGVLTTTDGGASQDIALTAAQDVIVGAAGRADSDEDIDINAGRSINMNAASDLTADANITADGGAGGTLDLDALSAGGNIQVGATANTAAVNGTDAWIAGGFASVDGTTATLLAVTASGNNGGTGISVNATTTDINVNGALLTNDGGGQDITLTAANDVNIAATGSINSDDDVDIDATAGSVNGNTAATINADGNVAIDGGIAAETVTLGPVTADDDNDGAGDITIGGTRSTADVTLNGAATASGNVSVTGAAIDINNNVTSDDDDDSAEDITIIGTGAITQAAGNTIDSNTGGIRITSTGGDVTIRDLDSNGVNQIDGQSPTIAIGAGNTAISVRGTTVTMPDTGTDNITATAGDVDVFASTGNIQLGDVNASAGAGQTVYLEATDSITDNNDATASNNVVTDTLRAQAANLIGLVSSDTVYLDPGDNGYAGNPLETSVTTLFATTTAANSDIAIDNTDAGAGLNIAVLGVGDGNAASAWIRNTTSLDVSALVIDAANNAADRIAFIASGGDLTLQAAAISVDTTGILKLESSNDVVNLNTLTANDFILKSATTETVTTTVANLDARVTGAGNDLTINENDGVLVRNFDGHLDQVNGADVSFSATDALTLNSGQVGSGNVTLREIVNTTTGAIIINVDDTAGTESNLFTADTVNNTINAGTSLSIDVANGDFETSTGAFTTDIDAGTTIDINVHGAGQFIDIADSGTTTMNSGGNIDIETDDGDIQIANSNDTLVNIQTADGTIDIRVLGATTAARQIRIGEGTGTNVAIGATRSVADNFTVQILNPDNQAAVANTPDVWIGDDVSIAAETSPTDAQNGTLTVTGDVRSTANIEARTGQTVLITGDTDADLIIDGDQVAGGTVTLNAGAFDVIFQNDSSLSVNEITDGANDAMLTIIASDFLMEGDSDIFVEGNIAIDVSGVINMVHQNGAAATAVDAAGAIGSIVVNGTIDLDADSGLFLADLSAGGDITINVDNGTASQTVDLFGTIDANNNNVTIGANGNAIGVITQQPDAMIREVTLLTITGDNNVGTQTAPVQIDAAQIDINNGGAAADDQVALENQPENHVTNFEVETAGGNIFYSQQGQNLTVNGNGIISGGGNLIIDPPGDVVIDADINLGAGTYEQTNTGSYTINATRTITAGVVHIVADSDHDGFAFDGASPANFVQTDGTGVIDASGNVIIEAANIQFSDIQGDAAVTLRATGDGTAEGDVNESTSDAELDVTGTIITIEAADEIGAAGDGIEFNATTRIDTTSGGDTRLNAADNTATNITFNAGHINAGANTVTLNSEAAVVDANAVAGDLNLTAGVATVTSGTSATAGSSAVTLDTAVTSVTVDAQNVPGGISIDESDDITLTALTTTDGAITVDALGSITSQAITMTAGNDSLTYESGTGILISNAIDTGTGSIVMLADTGAIDLDATLDGGTIDLQTGVNGGNIEIDFATTSDTGLITLDSAQNVNIDAPLSSQSSLYVDAGDQINVSATGSATAGGLLEFTADGRGAFTINIDSQVSANGSVFLMTSDGSIDADALVQSTADSVIISSGSNVNVTEVTGAGGNIEIGAVGGVTATDLLTADSDVLITAGGAVAVDDVTTTNGDFRVDTSNAFTNPAGAINVGDEVVISAATTVTTTGNIDAANGLTFTADGIITTNGTVEGGTVNIESTTTNLALNNTVTSTTGAATLIARGNIVATNTVSGADNVNITAEGSVDVAAVTAVAGDVSIDAGTTFVNSALVQAADDVIISADTSIITGANLTATGGNLNLTGGVITTTDDTLQAANDITINGSGIVTLDPVTAGAAVTISGTNAVNLDGAVAGLSVAVTSVLGAVDVDNTIGATVGGVTITADGNVDLDGAVSAVTGAVTLVADADDDGLGNVITSANGLINGNDVNISGRDITTAATVTADAGGVVVTGQGNVDLQQQVTGSTNITIESDGSVNVAAVEAQGGDIDISAATTFANSDLVRATDDVRIAADTSIITGADVTATGGNAALTGGIITTTGNTLTAGNDAIVNGGGIVTLNTVTATNAVAVTGTTTVNLDGAVNGASVSITSVTDAVDVDNTINAATSGVTLTADGNVDISAAVSADTGTLTIVADSDDDGGNVITSATGTLAGNELVVSGQDITTAATVTADAGGISVVAEGNVDLQQQVTASTGVTIEADGSVDVAAVEAQGGDIAITAATTFANSDLVRATDDVTVSADTSIITAADVTATGGDLSLTGGIITTTDDTLTAGDDVIVNGTGVVTLNTITATNAVTVSGATTVNLDGVVNGTSVSVTSVTDLVDIDNNVTASTGNINLNAEGNVDIDGAVEATNGILDIVADNGDVITSAAGALNANEILVSGQNATLGGTVTADSGDVLVTVVNDFTNAMLVGASDDVSINADNSIITGADVTATAGDLSLTGGIITTSDDTLTAGNDLVVNGSGVVTLNVVTGANSVTITGADNVNLDGAVEATAGTLAITSDSDDNGTGNVTSTAGGTLLGNDVFITGQDVTAAATVTADAGNITIDSEGTVLTQALLSATNDVNAEATGTITTAAITATNDVRLDAGTGATTNGVIQSGADVDIIADTGAVAVNANITATGAGHVTVEGTTGAVTMSDGSIINADSGTISLTSGGDVTVSQLTTTNATEEAVLITAAGDVIDGGDAAAGADIIANSAGAVTTINSGAGVGDAGAAPTVLLETTVDTLVATVSGAGNIGVVETDALTIRRATTANGGIGIVSGGQMTAQLVETIATDNGLNAIILTSTGAGIEAGSIRAGVVNDVVLLASGGPITDAPGDVVADDLSATAAGDITLTTEVTSATFIAAAGASDVNVEEQDAIQLDNTNANDFAIAVVNTGDITDGGNNDVDTLVATTVDGSITFVDINNLDVVNVVADGDGRNVNITSATDMNVGHIEALVDTINLVATNGAINELGADAVSDITADTINLTAGDEIGTVALPIEVDASIVLNATSGGLVGEDIVLTDTVDDFPVGTINAALGNVVLLADDSQGGGAVGTIVDAADGNVDIVAADANLTALTGVGLGRVGDATDLDVNVDTTTISVTGRGEINVDEVDNITITSARTADGDIRIRAGVTSGAGSIAVGLVDGDQFSDNTVTLIARDNITDDIADPAIDIWSGAETNLTVTNGAIATAANPLEVVAGSALNLTAVDPAARGQFWAVLTGLAGGTDTPENVHYLGNSDEPPARIFWNGDVIAGQEQQLFDYFDDESFYRSMPVDSSAAVVLSDNIFFLHAAAALVDYWRLPTLQTIHPGIGSIINGNETETIDVQQLIDEAFAR